MASETIDIAIVGSGAAGLMAGIWAGRTLAEGAGGGRGGRVVAFDSAVKLGAKILVAGGGRCNVTHHAVDEHQYAGSSPPAIRNVLRRFDVEATVGFFAELGVELKREDTGKLFPVTDDAHTVLHALLHAAEDAGVTIVHPAKVVGIRRIEAAGGADGEAVATDGEFELTLQQKEFDGTVTTRTQRARRVILAAGGKALPKSGSDGSGYELARALGHTTTERIFPALVPMLLPEGHWMRGLSGIAVPATIELRAGGKGGGSGKRLKEFTNSVLFTHFGVSGPGVLDISRYWTAAAGDDEAGLVMNFAPGVKAEELDRLLVGGGSGGTKSVGIARWLSEQLPVRVAVPGHGSVGLAERVARAICAAAGVEASTVTNVLTREQRRAVVMMVTECPLPVCGDRGFTAAEVTAGGVPLREVQLATMESRVCPGLYLCGEILDVDGRIGGFNFQWAWASGFVAGRSAASED